MNSTETTQFVRYIAALFPATKVDAFTADAWHDVLHRYDLEDARAAGLAVSERQAFCALADIVGEVKRIRARRLDGFVYVPGDGDGDPQVYLARRRAQIELVASGRRAADPEKALTAGPDQVVVGELVSGVGQPVPEESR